MPAVFSLDKAPALAEDRVVKGAGITKSPIFMLCILVALPITFPPTPTPARTSIVLSDLATRSCSSTNGVYKVRLLLAPQSITKFPSYFPSTIALMCG